MSTAQRISRWEYSGNILTGKYDMIHFVPEYQHKRELYIIIIVANNLSVN